MERRWSWRKASKSKQTPENVAKISDMSILHSWKDLRDKNSVRVCYLVLSYDIHVIGANPAKLGFPQCESHFHQFAPPSNDHWGITLSAWHLVGHWTDNSKQIVFSVLVGLNLFLMDTNHQVANKPLYYRSVLKNSNVLPILEASIHSTLRPSLQSWKDTTQTCNESLRAFHKNLRFIRNFIS